MIVVAVTNRTLLFFPGGMTPAEHGAVQHLREELTFPNPQWAENDRLGHWNGRTPKELCFLQEEGDTLVLPRGFTRRAIQIVRGAGIECSIDDRRRSLPEVDFAFRGALRNYQEEAVTAMAARDFGTLSSPTGSGKTTMALALIAKRRQPALVVLHVKELLHQWLDRIETFLGIPADKVGRIGAGKVRIGKEITVALVQSLYKCAAEVASHVGHVVVDECHRAPSRTFTECITAFDCRYQLGLSATPWRRDGLSRLIWWCVGDKVHEVEKGALVENGSILQAEVVTRETAFQTCLDASTQYSRMLSELTQDRERNRLIASDVAAEARNGSGVCLVLSDRKAHCEALKTALVQKGVEAEMLTGDLPQRERARVVEALNSGSTKVVCATGQLVGEGFDCKALSTLFLACPVKFDGRLLQYLGRVLRPAPGKSKARVFDYVDRQVGVLRAAARARRRAYKESRG